MKIIDTSVVSATKGYPGLSNVNNESITGGDPTKMLGLDFLQQNVLDMVDAICRGMIVDPTKPTVIAMFPLSSMFAGVAPAQYVYYNGEVFFVPSYLEAIALGGYQIANLEPNPTDNGSTAPQTVMSDGSTVSIHNQRTVTVTSVTSGTGNFPAPNTWLYPQQNFKCFAPVINVVGAGGQPAYAAGWSASTKLVFYILGNEVTIQGDASWGIGASPLIFTLPTGYRPPQDLYFQVTGGETIALPGTSGAVNYLGSTSAGGYVNFTIKFTIL